MKRKYKLLIIIIISGMFTCLIYNINKSNKINIMAIGDGISSGETSFNIDGISYNDYLKEYFYNKKILKNYNDDYSYKNNKINDLLQNINNNQNNKNGFIKQLLNKADLITISIGEEELTKLAITNDLEYDYIKTIINKYDNLINIIKEITESKIILIGFYENKYLDKSKIIILNSELSNIAKKYNIIFININDLLVNNDYFVSNNSYYFNYKGHIEIAKLIINSI